MENYWPRSWLCGKGPVATQKAVSKRGAGWLSKSDIHAIEGSETTKNTENSIWRDNGRELPIIVEGHSSDAGGPVNSEQDKLEGIYAEICPRDMQSWEGCRCASQRQKANGPQRMILGWEQVSQQQ